MLDNLHSHLWFYFSIIRFVVSIHLIPKDLFVAIICWLPLELIAWSSDQCVWLMLESYRCSSSIPCYKLMCLPGLLSTFRIFWAAMISICLLLHLVRTLTPLLSSGTVFSTSSQLQQPKTPDKYHLTASDPGTIWPVTSFSIQRLDYMTPCPMVPISWDLSTKDLKPPSHLTEDLAIEPNNNQLLR